MRLEVTQAGAARVWPVMRHGGDPGEGARGVACHEARRENGKRGVHHGKLGTQLVSLHGFALGANSSQYCSAHDLPDEACVTRRIKMIAAEHGLRDIASDCTSCLMAALKLHLTTIIKQCVALTKHITPDLAGQSGDLPHNLAQRPITVRDMMTALEVGPNVLRDSSREQLERIALLL
ncbi:hypothetical protein CYMTET_34855 [Cymbomonas tetramitiformis]|uniref:Uncharacterized protein n=1 Tax=Cymbomonas tetramitiformis TaxID=36881 RepID=A0AAE0FAG0_9CHLO|nr:hypothetical protein CYMTET_34855 [Cymbomonas tetramitiformis]